MGWYELLSGANFIYVLMNLGLPDLGRNQKIDGSFKLPIYSSGLCPEWVRLFVKSVIMYER